MPGSENELKHLLINLINNAKDAFNDKNITKRKLRFEVSRDTELHLSVEDNAGGIDHTIQDKIFQPRVSTKSDEKGSGIGLYMSSQIVEKHHGKLLVENTAQGAKFSANFPLQ
jgi:two-component system, sensor histidine kinase and response regulator